MAIEREDDVVRNEHLHMDVHEHDRGVPGGVRRISWGAIFGGVVVALVIQLLLSLLGLGIGMSVVDPQQEENPLQGLGMGAAIWWVITALISLFAGGWAAGYLAGVPRKTSGALHGVVTWGLATLLTLYLVTTAVGSIIGGTMSLASQGLQSAAGAIGGGDQTSQQSSQDRQQTFDRIRQEAEQILRDTGNPDLQPEALREELDEAQQTVREEAMDAVRNPRRASQELNQMLDELQSQGREVLSEVNREEMTNVLVENTDMSRQEARQTVDNWQRDLEQAQQRLEQLPQEIKQQSEEYGQRAAEATASAALWSFFALLVGLVAAMIGGSMGAPRHLLHDRDDGAYTT